MLSGGVRMKPIIMGAALSAALWAAPFTTADLRDPKSVGDVRVSPDGKQIAYTVIYSDTDGRPYTQIQVLTIANGRTVKLGQGKDESSDPEWSPDGSMIA